MQITIRGEAVVDDGDGIEIVGAALKEFDQIEDTRFTLSEYFRKEQKPLNEAGVKGGYLKFVYNDRNHKLYAETTYECGRKLTPAEEKILEDYTAGQWSDGIGEGFEQQEQNGAYLSAWYHGQKRAIIYS